MKRTIIFSVLFFMLAGVNMLSAQNNIDLGSEKKSPPPRTKSVVMVPVSAYLFAEELSVSFDYAVGTAIITITNENQGIAYYNMVDTNSTSEVQVPVDTWLNGKYTLRIEYSGNAYCGQFELILNE